MGNMFGNSSPGVSEVANPTASVTNPLYNWLSGQIGQPGPLYSGQITAPMSSQEQASLNAVDQYGSTPLSANAGFNNAQNFTNGMLTNNFNPTTSPYYNAVKQGAATNLGTEENQIASDAGGAGQYWSGSRLTNQANAATQSNENLNSILGQLQLQNTQNQISTLPMANTLAQEQQQQPLQQATALQTLGALPQQLQQNTDNALLNQFYQSQYQYPLQVGSLAAGVSQPPVYQQNSNPLMTGLGSMAGNIGSTVGSMSLLAAMGII